MKPLTIRFRASILILAVACRAVCVAEPDPNWLSHDRRQPAPPVVDPGTPSTQEAAGRAPSDAVVLFDGKDLSQWVSMDGSPTKWIVGNGFMECVKGSGYVRTLQNFGDCQLHIEWAAPAKVEGNSQGRGNSGVFFGGDRYEIQVLDSFNNKTYSDGSAGSVYGQYAPLVNANRPPGQWQSYDIVYTAPRFDAEGKCTARARVTVFLNGVLIQNNVELTGPTGWLGRTPYQAHPEKQPISLQDHGNPVRYRNIWVRELGQTSRKELTLSGELLDKYVGAYGQFAKITREGDQLILIFHNTRFVLFAESPTHFFAKTTDVQCNFEVKPDGTYLAVSVGEDGGTPEKKQ